MRLRFADRFLPRYFSLGSGRPPDGRGRGLRWLIKTTGHGMQRQRTVVESFTNAPLLFSTQCTPKPAAKTHFFGTKRPHDLVFFAKFCKLLENSNEASIEEPLWSHLRGLCWITKNSRMKLICVESRLEMTSSLNSISERKSPNML